MRWTGRYGLRQLTASGTWQAFRPDGSVIASGDRRQDVAEKLYEAWREAGASITAAAPPSAPALPNATDVEGGTPFYAILTFIGTETSDGRLFKEMTWRAPPLPWLTQFSTEDYHDGAVITGRIDTITLDGNRLLGEGVYDNSPDALRAVDLARKKMMYGVSVDPTGSHYPDWECMEYDDNGWCVRERTVWPTVEICAATQVSTPAFSQAMVSLDAMPTNTMPLAEDPPPAPEIDDEFQELLDWLFFGAEAPPVSTGADVPGVRGIRLESTLVASDCGCGQSALVAAIDAPAEPPSSWFADPGFTADHPAMVWADRDGNVVPPNSIGSRPIGVPLSIDDNGQMYGHVALWESCHIGYPASCTPPPHSASGYSYFHTGVVRTAEGSDLSVGVLTLGAGHASTASRMRAAEVIAHYDNSGTGVADIRLGEDSWGIWAAGAVRPGLTEERQRELRGTAPSGDWRKIGTGLELVAVLQVNVPGYPIPREELVASSGHEDPIALVASGGSDLAEFRRQLRDTPLGIVAAVRQLQAQMRGVQAVASELSSLAADRIRGTVRS